MNNIFEKADYSALLKGRIACVVNCDENISESIDRIFTHHGADVSISAGSDISSDTDILIIGVSCDKESIFDEIEKGSISKELCANFEKLTGALEKVIDHMKSNKRGNITTIIPEYSEHTVPGAASLSALSGAVKSFIKSIALDYCKYNIKANCIECNTAKYIGDDFQPLRGRLEYDDIANAALFLSSPMSEFISGESIPVNGGRFCIGHNQVWKDWLRVI